VVGQGGCRFCYGKSGVKGSQDAELRCGLLSCPTVCRKAFKKSIMIHEKLIPPKSHDLSYLLNLTLPHRPMWEVFRKDFQLLSAYAVEYRYPGESATKEMAREALRCCSKFREQFDREIGLFVSRVRH